MSMISIFYLGDKQKITEAISKDYSLQGDESVTKLDVTYTIGGHGLVIEDLDNILPKKFLDYQESVLYGNPNQQKSESQLILLSPGFATSVAKMTDEDLLKVSERISAKRKETYESFRKINKPKWYFSLHPGLVYLFGITVPVILFLISLSAEMSRLTRLALGLGMAIIIVIAAKYDRYYQPKRTLQEYKTVDFTPELKELRSMAKQSKEKRIPLLYYWSL